MSRGHGRTCATSTPAAGAVRPSLPGSGSLPGSQPTSSELPGAFFPLAVVVVGTRYFPFTHLYGEWVFLVAGVVQTIAGFLLLVNETSDSLGGYVMTGLLLAIALALLLRRDRASFSSDA